VRGVADELTKAIEGVDLPGLVARLWPESGAKPGRPGLYRAAWRGDRKPSLSLFRARGMWFWKDHGTGEGGNAYHLLVAAGFSKEEAVRILLDSAALPPPPPPEPKPAKRKPLDVEKLLREARERLLAQGEVEELKRRGIALSEALDLGMGLTREGDLVFPIFGPEGGVEAVKVRYRAPKDGQRYRYLTPGVGTPPWYGPGYGAKAGVLVVEGELNGVALYLALGDVLDVVGVAGTNGKLPAPDGRPFFLLLDGDEAGRKAALRWREEVGGYLLEPLGEGDACDLAGRLGREALRKEALSRVAEAMFSQDLE